MKAKVVMEAAAAVVYRSSDTRKPGNAGRRPGHGHRTQEPGDMAENITYEKALEKSEELKALEFIVKAFVELAPKGGVMCSGCIWDNAIKPLALSVVGWERIPRDGESVEFHALLSSRETWETVTEKWIAMLDAADPGRGHGVDAVTP